MLDFARSHDPREEDVADHIARMLVADLIGREPSPNPMSVVATRLKTDKSEPVPRVLESELLAVIGKLEKQLRKEGWSVAELDFSRRELRRFTDWAVAQPDLQNVMGLSREAMFRYEAHLRSDSGGGVKAATAHILLRPVRKLFAFLSVPRTASGKRLAPLQASKVVELLEAMGSDSPWVLRDRAVTLLLCREGFPASVVDNLVLGDLELEEGRLRGVALSQDTLSSLVAYVSEVPRLQVGPHVPLFLNQQRARFQTSRLARSLRHQAKMVKVELPKPFGLASLRPQPGDVWPRLSPPVPSPYDPPESDVLARLLQALDGSKPVALMDAAILCLLARTQLELEVLEQLTLDQILLGPQPALDLPTGPVALDEKTARAVAAYLQVRPDMAAPVEPAFLVSPRGTRFRANGFRARLRSYCRRAGLPSRTTL